MTFVPLRFLPFLNSALACCALAGWLAAACAQDSLTVRPAATSAKMSYPATRTIDHVDEYHGERIADPYRWLEDPNTEETQGWVTAQNEVTEAFLAKIPKRQEIRDRLTKLWNYE